MSELDSISEVPVQQIEDEPKLEINPFVIRLDVVMIRILQKFYRNGLPFPNDTNCYYIQQLFSELNREGFNIEMETLRKRLDQLTKMKLLEKVDTYPRIYMPIRDVVKVQDMMQKILGILL